MTQELKQGTAMGPELGFQGGGAEQSSCLDGGGQPQGDGTDQQQQGASQTGYPGGYGPIADHAGDCSCGSQAGQPGPVGVPAPGAGYPGFAPMAGYPGANNPAPAPDSHDGGYSCGSQPGGPTKGMSPAGQGPQPHCEHHFAHPGPMPGPFPGPMYGPMPGAAYGVHPGFGPANSPMGQAFYQKDAQVGQMMGLFNDIVSGKSDMSQVAGFLGSMDSGFWKGAAVGAGLALLLSSSSVKEAISGMFSGLTSRGSNDDQTAPAEGLGE